MKKMLLLFFTVLSLGLGHGMVVGMDLDEQLAMFENSLPALSDAELHTTLTNLIVGKWTFSSSAQVQAIRTEINRRDADKPYKITFNDPNILSAFIKKAFTSRAPTVEWFLDRGIPVDGLDNNGYTALMTAVSVPVPDLKVTEILLKNHADQNIKLVDTNTKRPTSPRRYAESQVTQSKVSTQSTMKLMNTYNRPPAAPTSPTASTSSTAPTATSTTTPSLDVDDENDDRIKKLFLITPEELTDAEKETDEYKMLNAVDGNALMNFITSKNISPSQALLILISKTPGSGEKLEEKINHLIEWHKTNKPNVRFKDSDDIWMLVRNYGQAEIQSLPGWIKWFIQHGPHHANGTPVIDKRGQDSAIDLAMAYKIPAVVKVLLDHGQKPSQNAIHYAQTRGYQDVLDVVNQAQPTQSAASTSTTASSNTTAPAATEQTAPRSKDPDWHPDLRLAPGPTPTQPQAIQATAGVKTRDEFPQATAGVKPYPYLIRTAGAQNLTPDQLKLVLIYIDDTQHPAEYYGQGLRALYPNVDFNSYYLYDDHTQTYINPLLYALQKNTPHGLAWAQLLAQTGRKTRLATAYYINDSDLPLSEELKNTPLLPAARTWLESQGVEWPQVQAPKLSTFQWNAAKAKILAAVASIGFAAAFYHWLTGKTEPQKANVLINNTGTDIFVRGSDTPIAANKTFALPTTGTLWVKLAQDQPDAKDLKIDIDSYELDQDDDSYLNLSIRKKWFANWFTVPLTVSEQWVEKAEATTTE